MGKGKSNGLTEWRRRWLGCRLGASGLSAMRSVGRFLANPSRSVGGGGGPEEVTGSRRVWLAAVGFCRHAAERNKGSLQYYYYYYYFLCVL